MWMLPLTAHAAEGTGNLLQTVLHSNLFNVVLVLITLGWLANKFNVGQALTAKQTALATTVQQVEQQKQQAQQALQQLKQRSEQLHREIDQILTDARQSADAAAQHIIANAEQEAERIKQRALQQQKQLITQAQQTAEQGFLRQVLDQAEAELRQRTGQGNTHGAIDQFIDGLPQLAGRVG
jgi:F-type H+-transporting ATPase subunit b